MLIDDRQSEDLPPHARRSLRESAWPGAGLQQVEQIRQRTPPASQWIAQRFLICSVSCGSHLTGSLTVNSDSAEKPLSRFFRV